MESNTPECFGSETQQGLQRRAWDLWQLLRNDSRFCSHGRAVATSGHSLDTVTDQIALARLQGVGPADGVPKKQVDERRAQLTAAGLELDEYVQWTGSNRSFEAAYTVIKNRALPDDLTLHRVTADTDAQTMAALDQLTQVCDVLLPMGPFIRGVERPSACVFAADGAGKPVCVAAAVLQFGPDHPNARQAWWGMLSTDPARRGEGLALILGAHAMLDMVEQHGIEGVFTGIRAGNTPSEALCSKLGLSPTDAHDVIAIYPPAFGAAQMTK